MSNMVFLPASVAQIGTGRDGERSELIDWQSSLLYRFGLKSG